MKRISSIGVAAAVLIAAAFTGIGVVQAASSTVRLHCTAPVVHIGFGRADAVGGGCGQGVAVTVSSKLTVTDATGTACSTDTAKITPNGRTIIYKPAMAFKAVVRYTITPKAAKWASAHSTASGTASNPGSTDYCMPAPRITVLPAASPQACTLNPDPSYSRGLVGVKGVVCAGYKICKWVNPHVPLTQAGYTFWDGGYVQCDSVYRAAISMLVAFDQYRPYSDQSLHDNPWRCQQYFGGVTKWSQPPSWSGYLVFNVGVDTFQSDVNGRHLVDVGNYNYPPPDANGQYTATIYQLNGMVNPCQTAFGQH